MNDFSEIEGELRKLRPAPFRAELLTRIEPALTIEPSATTASAGVLPPRRSKRANWISLGLGIGLATAAFLMMARVKENPQPNSAPKNVAVAKPATTSPRPSSNSRFLPAGLTEVVYTRRDEGLQFARNTDQPVRRIRYQRSETLQWRNPETGASLRVSYPSEEVILIPAPGQ
jgi:hypothetical protein